MKDLKKIQEFFSKPLKENTLKVGDKVSKKYASTEDDYTKEFEIISIEKDRAKLKDLKTGKTTGMSLSDLTKESLKEDMFGGDPLDQIFRQYAGKTIEMDFTDPESDWSEMLGELGEYLPDDQLSDFMESEELDSYLDDYNIRLIDPIVDKEIDRDILKKAKAKYDIDAMRKAANMPPLDSIASLNEDFDASKFGLPKKITTNMWDKDKVKADIENGKITQPKWFDEDHEIIDINTKMDMISFDKVYQSNNKRGLPFLNKYLKTPLKLKTPEEFKGKLSVKENMGFSDYSNNELAAYLKNNPTDKVAAKELHKRSQKLKNLSRTDIKEADLYPSLSQAIPEDASFKDFAMAVAKMLKNDYGSHNVDPFIKVLHSALDLNEAKGDVKVGDMVKVDGGGTYKRVEGTVGGKPAFVRVEDGKEGKKKTGLVDFVKITKVVKEGKQLDQVDFAKVVKAVEQTGHPVTVLLVPKFNEIEVITGMNAPDDMLRDLSNAVDSLGYDRNDIFIAGDSSNLSRREYSDIRSVNGGHKDYFEESVNELDINDPVMMKMRAAKDKLAKMRAANAGDDGNDYIFRNAKKLAALKAKRKEIMRDMEQEAEPEGGPIADRYGDMLNKIDIAIAKLSGQGKGNEYMSKDEIERRAAMIREAKPVANPNKHIKGIQIQLDQLGVKYEMDPKNKVQPFKVIYRPVNKDDRWYKDFDDIIFRYNLGGVVKTSMNEALMLDKYEVDFFHTKANVYANIEIPSENPTFEDNIQIKGTGKTEEEAFEDLKQNYENYKKTGIHEATKDEETTFHKKLDKLVHDTFGKRKGELEEAYVPSNIKEFAKRRGVSRLVNTVAGWAEKVGARITGGTAIGYNYNTLILDMGYQTGDIRINVEDETIELYDEPIYSFADFKRVFIDEVTRNQIEHDEEQLRRERGLEEIKQRVFNKLKK